MKKGHPAKPWFGNDPRDLQGWELDEVVQGGVNAPLPDAATPETPGGFRLCRSCAAPAEDDSEYCAEHDGKERERVRKAMRAVRRRKRKAKICAWCPRKAQPGKLGCVRCQIKRGRARPTHVVTDDVTKDRDRIAGRTSMVTEGDGRTRARYRGKHRGRASAAEMDREDIKLMRSLLRRLEDGLAVFRSAEVQDLPRIQRNDCREAALSHLTLLHRWSAEMLERHGVKPAASDPNPSE